MFLPTTVPARCRACRAALTPPGHVCTACGTSQVMVQQPFPPVVVAAKSPGVAVLLSFIWLGAGHLYANKTGLGVALMVYDACLVVLALSLIGLILALPLWLISAPFVMWHAASSANAFNRRNGVVVK